MKTMDVNTDVKGVSHARIRRFNKKTKPLLLDVERARGMGAVMKRFRLLTD